MTASRGRLVLVGTPLGHRQDLSPRARDAMLNADLLLCEDTRSVRRLLGPDVTLPPRSSCFVANENERIAELLARLADGEIVAYVSEAGMPVWSDPGARLVAAAAAEGFDIDVIPGPTAAATAVCHSGFDRAEVRFVGFPPRSGPKRRALLDSLASERAMTVFYEAGNRCRALLVDLRRSLPDAGSRRVIVARELTKVHQEVLRGTVETLAETLDEALRGEVTVVLDGVDRTAEADDAVQKAARRVVDILLDPKIRPRERARALADLTGWDARELYRRLVDER